MPVTVTLVYGPIKIVIIVYILSACACKCVKAEAVLSSVRLSASVSLTVEKGGGGGVIQDTHYYCWFVRLPSSCQNLLRTLIAFPIIRFVSQLTE